jgi:hypothetical protein
VSYGIHLEPSALARATSPNPEHLDQFAEALINIVKPVDRVWRFRRGADRWAREFNQWPGLVRARVVRR